MRYTVPTDNSCACNRTQPKPAAIAWRRAIANNNPTSDSWRMTICANNPRDPFQGFNLSWTDEIPF